MKKIGPKESTTRSCFDCPACKSERYACQGDSGFDNYCAAVEPRRWFGDSNWTTPGWCPALTAPAAPKEEG